MSEPISHQATQKFIDNNNYWGFWATLALTILIFIIFSILQSLFLVGYILVVEGISTGDVLKSDSTVGLESLLSNYALNGDAISVSQIPSAIIGITLVFLFVLLHKKSVRTNTVINPRGIKTTSNRTTIIKDYLDLYSPKLKHLLLFLGLMILTMVLMEAVNIWLDRPTPEFMTRLYSSTNNLPLLWIAVGISAPLFEEILFRGFFFEGLRNSTFSTLGAILLTSACWAIIHMQYGWFEIISIFFIGILLAIAKLKTKSLYVPIAMHMLMNLSASLGMELNV